MNSPQQNYSNERGSWFAGDGQSYPDRRWESRSDQEGAQPSVHYVQQVPYEEPVPTTPAVAGDSNRPHGETSHDGTATNNAGSEWRRGDPELAAVVRRDAGGVGEAPGSAGRSADAAPREGYPAAATVDAPTSQVPAFSVDPRATPHAGVGGRPEATAHAEEAGVPPSLASMLQSGPTGAHPTQPVQNRQPNQVADGTYRTKRPGAAVALVLATVLLSMPPLVLLWRSALDTGSPSGVIGGTLALMGLPLLAVGLYPLLGGGAATGAREFTALLRPPYLYLSLGLVLLVAAGLATG